MSEELDGFRIGHPFDFDKVGSGFLILRVSQVLEEFTIVGQDYQTFRVCIEPSYRIEATLHTLYQVSHNGPTRGVHSCAQHPPRLVQNHIDLRLKPLNHFPINTDMIIHRIRLEIQLPYHGAVDLNPPLVHESLRLAAGGDPGPRQYLLESLWSHWIMVKGHISYVFGKGRSIPANCQRKRLLYGVPQSLSV